VIPLIDDLDHMGIIFSYASIAHKETKILIQSSLWECVREAQLCDRLLHEVRKHIEADRPWKFTMENGTILFRGCLCVPHKSEVKMDILSEIHRAPYMVHPGETKTYQDMWQSFWWKRMKVNIAKYVASCGICQKVKAEHKRPAWLLKPLEIPEWKWENIAMDFVVSLPRSPHSKDAIWVVIDRLTKVVHFIPMKQTSSVVDLVSLCINEVVRLHGVPKSIMSN
jgi:hypothetical protein